MSAKSYLLTLLLAFIFSVGTYANDYVFEEGVNNVEAYASAYATFTATVNGSVVVETQELFSVSCNGTTYDMDYVPGATYTYSCEVRDVNVDDVVTIRNDYVMNTNAKVKITQLQGGEAQPVELLSYSPKPGQEFSWNTLGTVYLTFNKAITLTSATINTSSQSYPVSGINITNNNVGIDISDELTQALEDGVLNKGDKFYLDIEGVADQKDSNNRFNENGKLRLTYYAPSIQSKMLSATIGGFQLSTGITNAYKLKSYYDPADDSDGILVFEFTNDIKSVNEITLSMGNLDLISAGKYHRSNLDYTIDGNTVTVDLRGTSRTLHALFPNIIDEDTSGEAAMLDFDTQHITISMNNVLDINDNPVVSAQSGNVGSFAFTMGYEEVGDNVIMDGDNISDGDAVKAGQEIRLWISESITFDGINVRYITPDEPANIIVNEFTTENDNNGGITVSFIMPEMPNGIEGQPVTVSLINAKSENGIPHDLEINFVLGTKGDNPGDNPGGGDDPEITPPGDYQVQTYTATDGGIFYNMSKNGEWAVIRLGSSDAGGDAIPELYDVKNKTRFPIVINDEVFDIADVSNDGNIVVGSFHGLAASYNRTTQALTQYPLRKDWRYGELNSVTPDGKYAVGSYNCFTGNIVDDDDVPNDFYFAPIYVNIETGDTISTPGMPKYNMAHNNENATALRQISPDGRYIIGAMDWFYMQPASGCVFIYDTTDQTYRMIGFKEGETPFQNWTPDIEGLHHIESAIFSPDGHLIAGNAYMAKPRSDGSDFYNEYVVPFIMDMTTGETQYFDDGESNNIAVGAIDNEGTLFGNPDSGGPLRNFRVFYKNKFWIPFSEICQQRYDFNFSEKTEYEYTGTVMAVNGDGSRFLAFSDPTGESYIFDFGEKVEQACAAVNMFKNYSPTPQEGTVFSTLQTLEVNFGRAIQVLGKGNTHVHLYKEDGTLVANALSTADGLKMKTDSRTTISTSFRPTDLEDGVNYYVVIDAGAIAVSNDANVRNHEIRINYTGRNKGAVRMTKVSPESGSSLRQIDNEASYIMMTFDCPVMLSENYDAYILRSEDNSRITTLTIATGNSEETNKQIMLIPATTTYLYKDQEYKVVLAAGSLTDRSGDAASANEEITITYNGTYVREVTNEAIMFADDFNNPNASLNYWLMYEGDKFVPVVEMSALGFDANNTPWNFSTRDNLETSDYFATSHSMYTNHGKSDDWMMTPQLNIPEDYKVALEFDAQSYDPSKDDKLLVYVYENSSVLSNPLNNSIQDIKANAVLLDEITLTPGATMGNTAGEWTHFYYDLSTWGGKDIYVAFVNQNENQSAVFVDNVIIQRDILYTIGFNNLDRVVNEKEITIGGRFVIEDHEFKSGTVSMTLKDAEGHKIAQHSETIAESSEKPSFEFTFTKPLPLTVGSTNPYTIDIAINDNTDTFHGNILDLAFEPVKRVVLEEKTGYTCQFCPQGIISIEQCERTYGDRFIPISIHSYAGDRWGDGLFNSYSDMLGLDAAPSARINRIEGIYSPMFSTNNDIYYDVPEQKLWYNIVGEELNKLATCDINITANYDEDASNIDMKANLRYALNAENQLLSLFVVILENGLVRYQQNGLFQNTWPGLGEWGQGGKYGEYQASPVTHNDVVRACVGQTYSGTIGLFPTEFTAGEINMAEISTITPTTIVDKDNIYAVAMIIDTQSGEIVNAAKTKVLPYGVDGISNVSINNVNNAIYTITGIPVGNDKSKLPAGLYITNGRKFIIK